MAIIRGIAQPHSEVRPRVLCVDDEPQVLESFGQTLRRRFDISTAGTGAQGLRCLADEGPFAVIVSDFAMPRMNGAEFLTQARLIAPNAVRILLTGHATLENAIETVNRGHIFRFLTKPCPPTDLVNAIEDAVEQSRLLTADRQLLQRQLDTMSGHLVRAERLATLGTMAGAVGHELSNVLMAFEGVRSSVERAVQANTLPSQADLAALRQLQERLALHARNLLNLGRPARGTADMRTDLRSAISDLLSGLQLAGILRGIQIQLDVAPEPLVVRLGGAEIEQMLINLTKNAVEALADARQPNPVLRITTAPGTTPGTATCSISDNAAGIPESRRDLLFEPYYTTKPSDQGTGLGLFVVREIVRAAGGDVAVQSEVGRGSTFTIILPLADAA